MKPQAQGERKGKPFTWSLSLSESLYSMMKSSWNFHSQNLFSFICPKSSNRDSFRFFRHLHWNQRLLAWSYCDRLSTLLKSVCICNTQTCWLFHPLSLESHSQTLVPRSAASTLPEGLLEMQLLSLDLPNQTLKVWCPEMCAFTSSLGESDIQQSWEQLLYDYRDGPSMLWQLEIYMVGAGSTWWWWKWKC